MKFSLMLAGVLSLCLGVAGFAQDTPVPKTPIQDTNGPSHLGSEAPALAIDTDLETGNLLVAGFTLGAVYDSRGLYNTGVMPFYSSDTRFFFEPNVGFQRTFATGGWTLSYSPGISISQHDTSNDQYAQDLAGDFHWKPNPYVLLHARTDYSITNNPFETVGNVDLLPGLGGPFGPNYDGVLPQTRRTSLVATGDATLRVADHSAVGITGNFQKYNYDAVTTSAGTLIFPFIDSEVISGSVFYSQQFSPTVDAGVQLAYTDIYSTGAQISRTQAPAPMLFVKWNPSTRWALTFYGGPEYARTRTVVPPVVFTHNWYPTFGGTLAWSGHRNAFDAQGMRRISNGGGLLDAVLDTNAGAGYRTRLAPKLLAELRANWSDEKGIGLSSGDWFRSLWLGGGPVVELNRSLTVRLDAGWVNQSENGLSATPGNHLLVQGSLDYRFHKRLGD